MLLHRNTCTHAAAVIGHDKTLCTSTTPPAQRMALLCFSLTEKQNYIHTLTSIRIETKLSQINNVQEGKTQIKCRAMCSLNQQQM